MAQRSGLTRGDRRRNSRIEAVWAVVRPGRVVLAVDLGVDKQVAALIDHDCRVLGRRVVRVKAHQLGGLLTWAGELAAGKGFAGVVVACEPTGHRWRALMGLADAAGMGFVCVQSLRVHLEREADDYTRDKTDHKDAVLIGRLVTRLDCYLPGRADADWARMRHLGAHRDRLLVETLAEQRQIIDLLGCCWPTVLSAAARPLESASWLASLSVVIDAGGDLAALDRGGGSHHRGNQNRPEDDQTMAGTVDNSLHRLCPPLVRTCRSVRSVSDIPQCTSGPVGSSTTRRLGRKTIGSRSRSGTTR